ncbi:hypothetical protein [Streptomyces sp. NBC_00687]|nr:hypothetical protein [Streptomyces sp. NBC_00687]MCX4919006.1 hypothetical protein [Streptomyces sp. NBC_00687]
MAERLGWQRSKVPRLETGSRPRPVRTCDCGQRPCAARTSRTNWAGG